jgi:predicted MFS family arabinose efflux permease
MVYWTAFIGLFFDYYDLYLFIYLEKVLRADFGLTQAQSNFLQFTGLAGVGFGALFFGYLADRWGRGRMMVSVFGIYGLGVAGLSLAWNLESLAVFRLIASLALGAEWGISHTFMSEHVGRDRRYRFAALLQFAILGGLLAALASRYLLPVVGWRWLFAASIIPVALLSVVRGRWLARAVVLENNDLGARALTRVGPTFLRCFLLASLTIASGTVNVFIAKELPQSPIYTVFFWANVAPGMLLGAWVVRKFGVRSSLMVYASSLVALSASAWWGWLPSGSLAFALVLPVLNGIPFGLMGAHFNEVFAHHRTMLSGAAYNLGRILAGFAPVLITGLGLGGGGRYFLFTAALGVGVWVIGWGMAGDKFERVAG